MRKIFAIFVITLFLCSNIAFAANDLTNFLTGRQTDEAPVEEPKEEQPTEEPQPEQPTEEPKEEPQPTPPSEPTPPQDDDKDDSCPDKSGYRLEGNDCVSARNGCEVQFGNKDDCLKAAGHLKDFDENDKKRDFEEKKKKSLDDARRRSEEEKSKRDSEKEKRKRDLEGELRDEGKKFREDERKGDADWKENKEWEIDDLIYNLENRLWEAKDLEELQDADASKAIDLIEGKISDLKSIKNDLGKVDQREIDRRLQRHHNGWREIDQVFKQLHDDADRKRVIEEAGFFIEDKEYRFLEDATWRLEEAKELGVDTAEVDKFIQQVKDSLENIKKMVKSGDIDWKKFEKERRVVDRNEQKVWRMLEQLQHVFEVKRILEEIDGHMSEAAYAIEEFKAYGIDVSEAEKTMNLVKEVVKKVKELMREGKAKEAMNLFRGMEFVGRKMENLFRGYEKEFRKRGGGDLSENRIKDILKEAFERIPLAEEKIEEYKDEGIDTTDASIILEKIKGIVFKAKELYKAGDSEEAFFITKEAFPLASKLEMLFDDYEDKLYRSEDTDTDDETDLDIELGDIDDDTIDTDNTGKFSKLKDTIEKIRSKIKAILDNVNRNLPAAKERLTEYKEGGLDTSAAESLIGEIEDIVAKASEKYDNNDFIGALNMIEEAYPVESKLESEFKNFNTRKSDDGLQEEVEQILFEAESSIPRVRDAIQDFLENGIEVEKAQRLMVKIIDIVENAGVKYEEGDYENALELLNSAYPIGREIEILFEEYTRKLGSEDLKAQIDEIYADVEVNMPKVEEILTKVETEGIDTKEARDLLGEIKDQLDISKELYNAQEYGKALHLIKKAEELGLKLGQLTEEYFFKVENGETEKFLEEPRKEGLIERLTNIDKKDEFDIYDKDLEQSYNDNKDEIDKVLEKAKDEKKNIPDERDEEFKEEDIQNIEDLEKFSEKEFRDENNRDDRRDMQFDDETPRFEDNEFDDGMENVKREMEKRGIDPKDMEEMIREKMGEFEDRRMDQPGFDDRGSGGFDDRNFEDRRGGFEGGPERRGPEPRDFDDRRDRSFEGEDFREERRDDFEEDRHQEREPQPTEPTSGGGGGGEGSVISVESR